MEDYGKPEGELLEGLAALWKSHMQEGKDVFQLHEFDDAHSVFICPDRLGWTSVFFRYFDFFRCFWILPKIAEKREKIKSGKSGKFWEIWTNIIIFSFFFR